MITHAPWLKAKETQALMTALESARPSGSRFVGGCVRNTLMGHEVDDIDIATQLTPDEVTEVSTKAGFAASVQAHEAIFASLGAQAIRHSPVAQGAGHIIGTARMGDDPASSVVDRDLRSHEHPNLFVLGSSVFPTSATANPTLTIAALSLRAADPVKATVSG